MTTINELYRSLELPEGFRDELINGEIHVSPSPSPTHFEIQDAVVDQMKAAGFKVVYEQTLTHPAFGDEPRPDVAVFPPGTRKPLTGYYNGAEMMAVIEIVSKSNHSTDTVDKVEMYARWGVPRYLIIDPRSGSWLLYSDVVGGRYRTTSTGKFGETVKVGERMSVRTEEFDTY
ncbi:Uma2 family endonuclease [Actinocorallia lasiicapitis]